MSCDNTKPDKGLNEIDRYLAAYRDSHRAVARYSLILKEHTGADAPFKVIETGLTWDVACQEQARRNEELLDRFFNKPVYSLKLENAEEAKTAVQKAASQYWENRGHAIH